jgi:archaemetzincin
MRNTEGKNTSDEEMDFCPKCKTYLQGKGWLFGKLLGVRKIVC